MSVSEALGAVKEVQLAQGTVRYRESGSGEPIVFVHGLLVNGDLWRKVVPLLARNFRCIVPDWPLGSHSVSLKPDADLTPPGVAHLIADFMAALELKDVTLVGNDTGGALCQLVITEHPQRIKRLVLTSCDAYDNFFPLAFRATQWGAWVPGFVALTAAFLKTGFGGNLIMRTVTKHPVEKEIINSYTRDHLNNKAIRHDLTKFLKGVSNRYTKAAAKKFPAFNKPVLLAWATEGHFFPVKDAKKLKADFPDARLEYIKDSYAFVSEDQPERLAELIEAFCTLQTVP